MDVQMPKQVVSFLRPVLRRMAFTSFNRISALMALAGFLWILFQSAHGINGDEIGSDAGQNLQSALNLVGHGVYGEGVFEGIPEHGFRREPFPNVLLAIHLLISSWFVPGMDFTQAHQDQDFLRIAKGVNVSYVAVLLGGLWILLRRLIRPGFIADGLSLVLFFFVDRYFIQFEINDLNTELPASACLVWFSLLLVLAHQQGRGRWLMASGLGFGLLVLTKASGAYVALVAIPILAFYLHCKAPYFLRTFALISLGFALAVLPWVVRNSRHFNRPVIAQGGGDVLLIRSSFNTMTPEEYRNSFYAYAPVIVRDHVLGPAMSLSENDFECGYKLDRFNRNLPCDRLALEENRYQDVRSFYQIGKRALPSSMGLLRDEKQAIALKRIRENPLQHILVSVPMAWRGLWSFAKVKYWLGTGLNFFAYASMFVAVVLGIVQKKFIWLAISIIPAGYFLFYAFLSHFIPRYSEPMIPLAFVCMSVLGVAIASQCLPSSFGRLRF